MRWLLLALVLPVLGACSSVAYYAQSIGGQLGVMAASRPVADVLADPDTDPAVRQRLDKLPELRRFAHAELRLPESDSYRSYAQIPREAVVWNVVAAPVDSLEARTWCYPVLGCARYRGYFDRDSAQAYTDALGRDGWDAAVEAVPAYSTLGWFSDPLPSTVIHWSLADIAGLVFHELAHESLYVSGDSAFNEAYAMVVQREGVRRWMLRHATEAERRQWRFQQRRRADFQRLLADARDRLATLYASDAERDTLLLHKAEVIQRLREDYAAMRQTWDGYAGFDRWFDRPLNNANFASIDTYTKLEPAFRHILEQVDGDMDAFHATCRRIAALPSDQRQRYMSGLLRSLARSTAGEHAG